MADGITVHSNEVMVLMLVCGCTFSCCRSTFDMSKLGRTRQIFALSFLRVPLHTSELMASPFRKKSTTLVVKIDRGVLAYRLC